MTSALVRGPARELGRHPAWRLRWFEDPEEGPGGSLLDSLRARYPQAFLLMAVGPMLGGAEAATAHAWLQGLADARGAAGDHRVSVVDFA